jgi:hypothetical protein
VLQIGKLEIRKANDLLAPLRIHFLFHHACYMSRHNFLPFFSSQPPVALIFHSLPSINANITFYFKFHLITFEIYKMSFVTTCFGLTRPSSGNFQLEKITTLHGFTRHYFHAVTARRRIWEIYARTSLTLFLCTAFTLCSLCVVLLGQACVSVPYTPVSINDHSLYFRQKGRTLGAPQSLCGHGGRREMSLPLPRVEPAASYRLKGLMGIMWLPERHCSCCVWL